MEASNVLSDFFTAIENDARIGTTHISIFAALVEFQKKCANANPIQVYSYQIMRIAKIAAPWTYHRCVRELSEYGYIDYRPSFNKTCGSKVFFPPGT